MKVVSINFDSSYKKKLLNNNSVYFGNRNQQNGLVPISKSNIISFKSQSPIFDLTSEPEESQLFIKNLMQSPTELHKKMDGMISQYGLRNFTNWYLSLNGYYGAYQKYIDNLYDNATSLDDLFKHIPNWSPWKIEEKFWLLAHPEMKKYSSSERTKIFYDSIRNDREVDLKIGSAPDIFQSENELLQFFKLVKDKKFNDKVHTNNNEYTIKQLRGGEFNNKFIYKIKKDNKEIILKMDRFYPEDAKSIDNNPLGLNGKKLLRKPKYISADSTYTNACINRYLELNGCNLIPKLYYYNHKENFALYEFIDDKDKDKFQRYEITMEYESLEKTAAKYKDVNKLGIFLNDTGNCNFLVDSKGNTKIIDLGHSSFIMPFKPSVKYYNIEFSNIAGADFRSAFASILYSQLEH